MLLERLTVQDLEPLDRLELSFRRDPTRPIRGLTVIHGDGATGKSALLAAIAATRPGRAVPLPPALDGERQPIARCEWSITAEDLERPHPLVVVSPNARPPVQPEAAEREAQRRREQAHFDRVAVEQPGFGLVEFPGVRWFSRSPLALGDPIRSLTRYDVRGGIAAPSGDPGRSDLTRPTKQALAYASIAATLQGARGRGRLDVRALGEAMRESIQRVVGELDYDFVGVDPTSLEPTFRTPGGVVVLFEALPAQLRQLVAIAAISTRTLWAAWRCAIDPRQAEGVVLVDDLELSLGPALRARVLELLRACLPKAQWIVTTSSPELAAQAAADELVALRRRPGSDRVEPFVEQDAVLH